MLQDFGVKESNMESNPENAPQARRLGFHTCITQSWDVPMTEALWFIESFGGVSLTWRPPKPWDSPFLYIYIYDHICIICIRMYCFVQLVVGQLCLLPACDVRMLFRYMTGLGVQIFMWRKLSYTHNSYTLQNHMYQSRKKTCGMDLPISEMFLHLPRAFKNHWERF